jgi:hypothetical protein
MTALLVAKLAQAEKILTCIGRYLVRISVATSFVLLADFRGFSHSLKTNALK